MIIIIIFIILFIIIIFYKLIIMYVYKIAINQYFGLYVRLERKCTTLRGTHPLPVATCPSRWHSRRAFATKTRQKTHVFVPLAKARREFMQNRILKRNCVFWTVCEVRKWSAQRCRARAHSLSQLPRPGDTPAVPSLPKCRKHPFSYHQRVRGSL